MSIYTFCPAYQTMGITLRTHGNTIICELTAKDSRLSLMLNPMQAKSLGEALSAMTDNMPLSLLDDARWFGDVEISFAATNEPHLAIPTEYTFGRPEVA